MECAPSCVIFVYTHCCSLLIFHSSIHIKSHKCYEIEITYCRYVCEGGGKSFLLIEWEEGMQIFEENCHEEEKFNREEGKRQR